MGELRNRRWFLGTAALAVPAMAMRPRPRRRKAAYAATAGAGGNVPVTIASTGTFNATGPYVLPGTVGYLGDPAALTSYAPPGSGQPGAGSAPPGWSWTVAGLRNDASPVSLDHAHVYGGLYTAGNVITVTNCVIQAGTASELACIQHHGASWTVGGGLVTVTDSTLSWLPSVPHTSVAAGQDVPPIFDVNGPRYIIQRCDLSGTPQGLDPPGSGDPANPSLVLNNWIHDIIQNKPSGPNHLDGLFSQGGNYLTVRGNYIDVFAESAPGASDVTACIFFHDIAGTMTGVTVDSNYLSGGGNTFYNETAVGIVVTNNVFSGVFKFGDALDVAPGTIGTWSNNKHLDGSTVPSP